ncbi:DUF2059 domain-containing protein [Tianweitania populi]|uniref:DUF2059 domain-containing protein n=1 Tax=Tianweitania populi TaxID=1607949 RepID=A0A8J3GJ05_9HYPH|nr:DUF2059 domain-containing protein [Tianweitania populi]GHD10144.1 hypothetical protein GCM10016234_11690 [Tianweitania populi]
MVQTFRARRLIAGVTGAVLLLGAGAAYAQEVTPSHLAAARAALSAVKITDQFDSILPTGAQALKQEMIQKDPNLEELIVKTVDEKTLELAKRRADLENEAAQVYARAFTEQELNEIATFYKSPAGAKLLDQGGRVTRDVMQAAEIWQRGISRDLAQSVADAFEPARQQATPAAQPAAGTPAPAATPAPAPAPAQ